MLNPDQTNIFNEILENIVCGDDVDTSAQRAGISERTFYGWLGRHKDLRPAYIEACRVRGMYLAEVVVKIINELKITRNSDEVATIRERALNARWYAGKCQPKVYGDTVHIEDARDPVKPLTPAQLLEHATAALKTLGMHPEYDEPPVVTVNKNSDEEGAPT